MNRENYQKIECYMQTCAGDSAHDREHIYRVLNNAMVIAQGEENVDYDVLLAACLLHDVARVDQNNDPSLCHAQVGSEKAYQFLLAQGFDVLFAEKVRACIRTHRFRKNDQPESLEAKILFDADKLDVVGAIGVARTLVYRGALSDPLYTRDANGKISDGTQDESHSFFQEYKFKLEKLYDRFYTQKGRELALKRRSAAEHFYNSLLSEVTALEEIGQDLLKHYVQ